MPHGGEGRSEGARGAGSTVSVHSQEAESVNSEWQGSV